jgi:hypothetical protein
MQKACLLLSAALLGNVTFAAEQDERVPRLPTVTTTDTRVTETGASGLVEERPVGETGRPEWTSARRFPTTRVYIQQDPWQVGVAAWWRYRNKRDNSSISRLTGEVEIGLPHRLQLDLYYDMAVDGDSRSRTEDFAAEIRYALADWGKIPMNPTLYAEYKWVEEGADVVELKLLLGDQFGKGWHYGINFVWEKEIGGERTTEWQIVGGLSKTLLDGKFGLGAEFKYVNESVTDNRTHPEHKFHVGPSAQWRITDQLHISASALIGLNREAPRQECYLIVGYDFGHENQAYQPVSHLRR